MEKVTFLKAAEMSGMTVWDFADVPKKSSKKIIKSNTYRKFYLFETEESKYL